MDEENSACTKCGGKMSNGYASAGEAISYKLLWMDGEPVHASLFGIEGTNIKVDKRLAREVRGMRCTACGFLELYAVES